MIRKPLGKIRNTSLRKRMKRKLAIRKRVSGTSNRPRLSIVRSNKNLMIQIIDDSLGKTLFCVQTYGKKIPKNASNTKEGAKVLGHEVANRLKKIKIEQAVCDRSGYQYHGVVAELIESVRSQGIQI